MKTSASERDQLDRSFEGRERLDALLKSAGSLADTEDVADAFRRAQQDRVPPAVVIDALFDDEPRFESAKNARALFSNLFGLWDALETGAVLDLSAPASNVRMKAAPVPSPGAWKGAPDDAWVEAAWRYLEDDVKERTRLAHVFENRQGALLTWLELKGLSDAALATVSPLIFELFAMLELGTGAVGSPDEAELSQPAQVGDEVALALAAYAEEALFEAEQDEEAPLGGDEAAQARAAVIQALGALWRKRRQ